MVFSVLSFIYCIFRSVTKLFIRSSFSCQMTVGKLMDAYEVCISSLRKAQGRRRTASLKRIYPANFSKDVRITDKKKKKKLISSVVFFLFLM